MTVYPAREPGGRWRAVWYEGGTRRQCEAATEDRLAARLEKVTERLAADAPNLERPGADQEDDGVLLSIVLDTTTGCSSLVILDARDLSELACAQAPHHIPFHFHGEFFEHHSRRARQPRAPASSAVTRATDIALSQASRQTIHPLT